MDKDLTIHEKYVQDMDELLQRHLCGEIDAHEYARKDRMLTGAYVYECLRTSDQGCETVLARLEKRQQLAA